MTFISNLNQRIEGYKAKVEDASLKIEVLKRDKVAYRRIIEELEDIVKSLLTSSDTETLSENSTVIKNNSEPVVSSLISEYLPDFPVNSSREQQILWIIENVFGRAAKRTAVESFYYKCLGDKARTIKFVFRGMVLRGDLIGNKYNSNNKLTYYGLPEWVDENGHFKTEHLPSGFGTAFKVDSFDVVSYDDNMQETLKEDTME